MTAATIGSVLRWSSSVLLLVACNSPSSNRVAPEPSVTTSASASTPTAAASASASASASATPAPTASAPLSNNAIDRLVARLAANPMWDLGGFSFLGAPEKIPLSQLLDRVFEKTTREKVTRHTILEKRTVRVGDDVLDYLACFVDTNLGRKIVLLRWMPESADWWSRVYDPV